MCAFGRGNAAEQGLGALTSPHPATSAASAAAILMISVFTSRQRPANI